MPDMRRGLQRDIRQYGSGDPALAEEAGRARTGQRRYRINPECEMALHNLWLAAQPSGPGVDISSIDVPMIAFRGTAADDKQQMVHAAQEAFDEAGAPYDELEKMKDTDPDRFDDYDRAMMFAQTQNINPDTIRWGQKHDFPHISARRRPPGGYDIPWSRKFEHGGYCNSLTGRIGSGLKAGSANDAP